VIENFKDITSENPIGQIWKSLRFFLDIPSVSEEIRRIHKPPKGKFDSDVKKQAKQIGYSIRQAEEYFQASSQVGIATRPTLLYYGAVSLSRALVLLRQDGSHSFDALRKRGKHNHHGLDIDKGSAANIHPDDGPGAFFNSLQCRLHLEEDTPWGHFALFYRSLVPCAYHIHTEIHDHGKATFLTSNVSYPCADLLPLDSLISTRFNALTLMKMLPDVYFALIELGIQPDLCRGSLKLKTERYYKKDEQGQEQLDKMKENHDFFIDSVSPAQKAHLLTFYQQHNPLINLEADLGANIYLKLTREFPLPDEVGTGYYPDLVDDINGRKFYILTPETYLPEPATHLVLLFCLGMLSRYYPDIWMRAIDENVQIAELTDSLLNIVYRKFPNRILDQMTRTKHYIHL